jgi:hypothetical protein
MNSAAIIDGWNLGRTNGRVRLKKGVGKPTEKKAVWDSAASTTIPSEMDSFLSLKKLCRLTFLFSQ